MSVEISITTAAQTVGTSKGERPIRLRDFLADGVLCFAAAVGISGDARPTSRSSVPSATGPTNVLDMIATLKHKGLTILLVEQNAQAALAIAESRLCARSRLRGDRRHRRPDSP